MRAMMPEARIEHDRRIGIAQSTEQVMFAAELPPPRNHRLKGDNVAGNRPPAADRSARPAIATGFECASATAGAASTSIVTRSKPLPARAWRCTAAIDRIHRAPLGRIIAGKLAKSVATRAASLCRSRTSGTGRNVPRPPRSESAGMPSTNTNWLPSARWAKPSGRKPLAINSATRVARLVLGPRGQLGDLEQFHLDGRSQSPIELDLVLRVEQVVEEGRREVSEHRITACQRHVRPRQRKSAEPPSDSCFWRQSPGTIQPACGWWSPGGSRRRRRRTSESSCRDSKRTTRSARRFEFLLLGHLVAFDGAQCVAVADRSPSAKLLLA